MGMGPDSSRPPLDWRNYCTKSNGANPSQVQFTTLGARPTATWENTVIGPIRENLQSTIYKL